VRAVLLFPGQGAQYAGMGRDLYHEYGVFKRSFNVCADAVSFDLHKACFEGDGLSGTKILQPAMYAVSAATFALLADIGIEPVCCAGLSLGEYAALQAGGAFGIDSGAIIVEMRGTIMESAVPSGIGGMTAVIGLDAELIESIIKDIPDVWTANLISAEQTVVSGSIGALDMAEQAFNDAGAKIIKRLDVSGPFHSPMLGQAAQYFLQGVQALDIRTPGIEVYSNVKGAPYEQTDDIKSLLSRQICTRVLWAQTMPLLAQAQAEAVIEAGPGGVLSKLLKKQLKQLFVDRQVFTVQNCEDIGKLREWMKR